MRNADECPAKAAEMEVFVRSSCLAAISADYRKIAGLGAAWLGKRFGRIRCDAKRIPLDDPE
jgi:hypothetical protein